ncbi:MAG: pseudouridine synthase [Nitrospiraceae bacterium]|nr:pseudouridine synthase [Nitrospiraceae bacterium]
MISDSSSKTPSPSSGSSPSSAGEESPETGSVRLHKLLAHRGVASRRKAEQLVASGLVSVNGQVVTEPGSRVNPETDTVLVEGKPLRRESEPFLFLFYKPKGVVSTLHDPEGRPTLREFFPNIEPLLHVGRLDFQTEGALLLTNNGDLSQRILHPRYAIPRTYLVKIQGGVSPAHLERIARGDIRLDGRPVVPMEFVPERDTDSNAWYRITLTEGRNREVRRLFETLNYFVLKLVRTAFGPLTLAGLDPGEYRTVTPSELRSLLAGETPTHLPRSLDSRHRQPSQDNGRSPQRSFREREKGGPARTGSSASRSWPSEESRDHLRNRISEERKPPRESRFVPPARIGKPDREEASQRPDRHSAPGRSRPRDDDRDRPQKSYQGDREPSSERSSRGSFSSRNSFRQEAPRRAEGQAATERTRPRDDDRDRPRKSFSGDRESSSGRSSKGSFSPRNSIRRGSPTRREEPRSIKGPEEWKKKRSSENPSGASKTEKKPGPGSPEGRRFPSRPKKP